MSAPAIISGDFSTFRHVQGRKVLQLVIEVPSEQAASVFSTFGYPGSGNPIPVAVAKLVAPIAKPEPTKERRAFTDMPYAQQAAIRCREPAFQQYVADKAPAAWQALSKRSDGRPPNDCAAQLVRDWCRVTSRSDIVKGTKPGDAWERIEAAFYAEQHGRRG